MDEQATQTKTVERKYALIRLSKGDYLLPSNDGQTLWRIYTYGEDGSAEWGNGKKIVGTFWGCAKYNRPLPSIPDPPPYDFIEWVDWEPWATTMATRQEAIREALRIDPAT